MMAQRAKGMNSISTYTRDSIEIISVLLVLLLLAADDIAMLWHEMMIIFSDIFKLHTAKGDDDSDEEGKKSGEKKNT